MIQIRQNDTAQLEELKTDPCALEERRWEKMQWRVPEHSLAVC